jgi:ABC-type tungstate transport system permease subunit
MYWCRLKLYTAIVLIGSILSSSLACRPDIKQIKYFDIKRYFNDDISGLKKQNKSVFKTVTINGVTESKKVKINNWAQELNLFTGSDINSPAWKNSYTITDNDEFLIYKARDPDLKMREMIIRRDKERVKWVLIFNSTKNVLYQTTEKLSYFPDSIYLIEKTQRVRLIGTNTYKIQGVIER